VKSFDEILLGKMLDTPPKPITKIIYKIASPLGPEFQSKINQSKRIQKIHKIHFIEKIQRKKVKLIFNAKLRTIERKAHLFREN
jgi:hypothetical protein